MSSLVAAVLPKIAAWESYQYDVDVQAIYGSHLVLQLSCDRLTWKQIIISSAIQALAPTLPSGYASQTPSTTAVNYSGDFIKMDRCFQDQIKSALRKFCDPKDVDTFAEPSCTVNITKESTETAVYPGKGIWMHRNLPKLIYRCKIASLIWRPFLESHALFFGAEISS